MTSIVFIKIRVQSSSLNFLIQYYSIWIHSNKKLNPFHSLKTCSVYRQSENLPRTRFSEVTSDINSWNVAFIKSRADTSTYLHWDVGYEQPSLRNRAQDVQKLFITPGQHRHVNNNFLPICLHKDSCHLSWPFFVCFVTKLQLIYKQFNLIWLLRNVQFYSIFWPCLVNSRHQYIPRKFLEIPRNS